MLGGSKDSLLRGNVVELAVAVVIGAASTAVVTASTDSFRLTAASSTPSSWCR